MSKRLLEICSAEVDTTLVDVFRLLDKIKVVFVLSVLRDLDLATKPLLHISQKDTIRFRLTSQCRSKELRQV